MSNIGLFEKSAKKRDSFFARIGNRKLKNSKFPRQHLQKSRNVFRKKLRNVVGHTNKRCPGYVSNNRKRYFKAPLEVG